MHLTINLRQWRSGYDIFLIIVPSWRDFSLTSNIQTNSTAIIDCFALGEVKQSKAVDLYHRFQIIIFLVLNYLPLFLIKEKCNIYNISLTLYI